MQLTAALRAWSDFRRRRPRTRSAAASPPRSIALGRAGTTLGSTMEQAVASFSQSAAATQSLQHGWQRAGERRACIGGVLGRGAEIWMRRKLATSAVVAMRDVLADMSSQGRQGADQIRAVAQQPRRHLAQPDGAAALAGTTDRPARSPRRSVRRWPASRRWSGSSRRWSRRSARAHRRRRGGAPGRHGC